MRCTYIHILQAVCFAFDLHKKSKIFIQKHKTKNLSVPPPPQMLSTLPTPYVYRRIISTTNACSTNTPHALKTAAPGSTSTNYYSPLDNHASTSSSCSVRSSQQRKQIWKCQERKNVKKTPKSARIPKKPADQLAVYPHAIVSYDMYDRKNLTQPRGGGAAGYPDAHRITTSLPKYGHKDPIPKNTQSSC